MKHSSSSVCSSVCSTERATISLVASRTVRARLDPAAEAALALLMQEGRNESDAVRTALIESAGRRRRRSEIAAEVELAAADPADRAARAEAMADMDAIGSPWPE